MTVRGWKYWTAIGTIVGAFGGAVPSTMEAVHAKKAKPHVSVIVPAPEWEIKTDFKNFPSADERYLDMKRPNVTSLENRVFMDPTSSNPPQYDSIPFIEDIVTQERRLVGSVHTWEAYYIDHTTKQPVAIASLKPGTRSYEKWQNTDEDTARGMMMGAAKAAKPIVAKRLGVKPETLDFRIGYSEILTAGILRASPFSPYFELTAQKYGLDKRLPLGLTLQETVARNQISDAGCIGWFQMGGYEAETFGLIVPSKLVNVKDKKTGKMKTKRVYPNDPTRVNENYHPMLQVDAAMQYIRARVFIHGSVPTATSAYHAGDGHVLSGTALGIEKNPTLVQRQHDALLNVPLPLAILGVRSGLVGPVQKQENLEFESQDAEPDIPPRLLPDIPDSEVRAPLAALAWVLNGGYKDPGNHSKYKEKSARYVPRVEGIISAVKPAAVPFFTADRVTVHYASNKHLFAKDLLDLFGNAEQFVDLNPHIPLLGKRGAELPEGTRVFLPVHTGDAFAQKFAPAIRPDINLIRYENGTISPWNKLGPWLKSDQAYAAIGLRRAVGGYESVKADEITYLMNLNGQQLLKEPTELRRIQQVALGLDDQLYKEKAFTRYLAAINKPAERNKAAQSSATNKRKKPNQAKSKAAASAPQSAGESHGSTNNR